MEQMEDKLNSILSDPQMMQQIMSMAQALGQQNQPKGETAPAPLPNMDPRLLSQISSFASQSNTNKEEQALLHALSPYLRRDRILKLEKAMRAAKMARFASGFLNAGGLQLLTGR